MKLRDQTSTVYIIQTFHINISVYLVQLKAGCYCIFWCHTHWNCIFLQQSRAGRWCVP